LSSIAITGGVFLFAYGSQKLSFFYVHSTRRLMMMMAAEKVCSVNICPEINQVE